MKKLEYHLQSTLQWLATAQDARQEDRGVSAAFSWTQGWFRSYPETTGYIINTFLSYARLMDDPTFVNRAREAGEWLLTVQFPNGAFPGSYFLPTPTPNAFNTGMILFGLAELAGEMQDERFLLAGVRALEWMTASQDFDGSWTTVSPSKMPYVYYVRAAWGMLEVAKQLPAVEAARHIKTAERMGEWVLAQQDADGWFRNNMLINGLPPITHNIAYTLRGLLEMGAVLNRSDFVEAATRGAEALWRDWSQNTYMASGYYEHWRRGPSFRCVTGEAQMGLVWFRLAHLTGEKKYRLAAESIALQVASVQWVDYPRFAPLYGAIPGAWPLWGRYLRFGYPNWAAKFFADLLMFLEVSPRG